MIGAVEARLLTAAIVGTLCLAGSQPPAGAAPENDPQAMLVEARERLERGDIEGARSTAEALRQTLEQDTGWDPDGCFADRLVPELERRIAEMRAAIDELETLPGLLGGNGVAPGPTADPADPESDLERGRLQAGWVRDELDRVASTIPSGPQRGALLQSESYARAADLVAGKVLPRMAGAVRERFEKLGQGDERTRAVKARMTSLKREIIDASLARERLVDRLAAAREDREAYRRVLIEFIGDDQAMAEQPASEGLQGIGLALAHRIREVWIDVRRLDAQSPSDKQLLLREIECLRLANVASIADGSRDLGVRIDALAAAVENVPVTRGSSTDPPVSTAGCMAALRR